jgi:hypothetical protein
LVGLWGGVVLVDSSEVLSRSIDRAVSASMVAPRRRVSHVHLLIGVLAAVLVLFAVGAFFWARPVLVVSVPVASASPVVVPGEAVTGVAEPAPVPPVPEAVPGVVPVETVAVAPVVASRLVAPVARELVIAQRVFSPAGLSVPAGGVVSLVVSADALYTVSIPLLNVSVAVAPGAPGSLVFTPGQGVYTLTAAGGAGTLFSWVTAS